MDPSLSRGCSAGSANPRRNSGAAGRCTLSAGRAEERRAREAARGKKEAIVKFVRAIRCLRCALELWCGVYGGDVD